MLHTTPYSESSVVAKVFTRQMGVKSYIIKGVRGNRGRVKQNLLQPLSSLDMVVYDNDRNDLNYIKELAPRHPEMLSDPVWNALRFFMTEVLYKALRESEPMPVLFDYVDSVFGEQCSVNSETKHLPIFFLLTVARHLGIEPLDNNCTREPYFDLQEGRFVSAPTETTLAPALSTTLHEYLLSYHSLSATHLLSPEVYRTPSSFTSSHSLSSRRELIDALITYYHLHLSGFSHFHSHEILHTILK